MTSPSSPAPLSLSWHIRVRVHPCGWSLPPNAFADRFTVPHVRHVCLRARAGMLGAWGWSGASIGALACNVASSKSAPSQSDFRRR